MIESPKNLQPLGAVKPKTALLSVSDKTGLVEFARGLVELGVRLISTGGTKSALAAAGLPVTAVDEVTGFPEILDGRVKTLHPAVHGGILADRRRAEHVAALAAHGITGIDLVVVNLYPFRETVAKPGIDLDTAIENIDIGGPAMVRASAKNFESVAVVVDPGDYAGVLAAAAGEGVTREMRRRLSHKAFAHTASYDGAIANYLAERLAELDAAAEAEVAGEAAAVKSPATRHLSLNLVQACRYGENQHQKAAFYAPDGVRAGLAKMRQVQGKELSYNNILDADAALRLVLELSPMPGHADARAVAIIKHNNPCGAALDEAQLATAFQKAFAVDTTSAFGGVVALSHAVDGETAAAMKEIFFEVIIAPSFSDEALQVLGKKKNLRLLTLDYGEARAAANAVYARVAGGYLVQEPDAKIVSPRDGEVVSKRAPSEAEYQALEFAWRVAKHVKSNAIVYAFPDRVGAVGAGQMSRVDSTRIAVLKAGGGADMALGRERLRGSVLASDAFFPFRDGVETAAEAGITAVVQPGGSVRDDEVIACADELGLAMVFTRMRHFRH